MHGLGKALPKGEAILVPFFCDMFVGQPLDSSQGKKEFMESLNRAIDELKGELPVDNWA